MKDKYFILFLDIDGVLNSIQSVDYIHLAGGDIRYDLCPIAVTNLQILVDRYPIKIVISSDWRRNNEINYLRELLYNQGLRANVIDYTPVCVGARGYEIDKWIKDIIDYIILDDCSDMVMYKEHPGFIFVDDTVGFDRHAMYKVEKFIKGRLNEN